MNDQQNQNQMQENQSGVSFPMVGEPQKKSNGAKTLLIAGILILIGILGFVIFKSATKKSDVISIDAPVEDNLTTPVVTQTIAPSPTSTPVASGTPKAISRSTVSIEIQNGTGITGEAAYLQNILKTMGYTKINVGNATTQDATSTTVTFLKTLSADVVNELTSKLQSVYSDVTVKTSTTQLGDAIIITGTRKGVTSATPKSTLKASPTASPKSSPTASPKATATP